MHKLLSSLKRLVWDRPIRDVFSKKRKNNSPRVLISYRKKPFQHKSSEHTNFLEVVAAAKIFDKLGYTVDVINFNTPLPSPQLMQYDVIYGFGDVFEYSFQNNLNLKRIYYGAGAHVATQNANTLTSLKYFHERHGLWLPASIRYVTKSWTYQTSLSDALIVLGNDWVKKTYQDHFTGTIRQLPTPFYQTQQPEKIMAYRNSKRRQEQRAFLWFGSTGCIHKGLDLVLDVFRDIDAELHVCANLKEIEFFDYYKPRITPNIKLHDFVNIETEQFQDILKKVDFAIFPSCSEGGSPALVTAVANGGLLPIMTKQAGVTICPHIPIASLSVEGVSKAVKMAQRMPINEVQEFQKKALYFCQQNHGITNYVEQLERAIIDGLNN